MIDMENKNINYEYKQVVVSNSLEQQWKDGYEKFGWKLIKSAPEKIKPVWGPIRIMLSPLAIFPGMPFSDIVKGRESDNRTSLQFKRNKNLIHKNELNRLQGYFENTLGEVEHMEQTKMVAAYMSGAVGGILGSVFMALSVFTFLVGNTLGCIGLAVPGVAVWILGAVCYSLMKNRKEKKIREENRIKSEAIDDICEKAYLLLQE